MPPPFTLRPYQQETVAAMLAAHDDGARPLAVVPTGGARQRVIDAEFDPLVQAEDALRGSRLEAGPIEPQSVKYHKADLRCATPQWSRCGRSRLMRVQRNSKYRTGYYGDRDSAEQHNIRVAVH